MTARQALAVVLITMLAWPAGAWSAPQRRRMRLDPSKTSTAACTATGTVRHVGSGQTYASISAGLTAATSGDTVCVHAGTYTEQITLKGSVKVMANPGDSPTVQSATSPVVNINGTSSWTIDGLNVTYTGSGATPHGIQNTHGNNTNNGTIKNLTCTMQDGTGADDGACLHIADSDGMTVDHVTMTIAAINRTSVGIDGCDFLFASHLTFTNNTISGAANATTGKLEDGCVLSGTDLTITDNYFHDGWAFDIHPDGIVIQGDGDRAGNPTNRVTIARNHIAAFDQLIYLDCFNGACSNLHVWNNWLEETTYTYGGSSGSNCIVIDAETAGGAMTGEIENNTLNCVNLLNLRIIDQKTSSSWTVRNNIFMHPFFTSIEIDSASSGFVSMDYDFMDTNGDSTPTRWNGTARSWSSFKTACSCESHSVNSTFTLNSDGTEPAGAPTINVGTDLSGNFTDDRLKVTRPVGGTWDMGSTER